MPDTSPQRWEIPIPLTGGGWAYLETDLPLSETQRDQLMRVLQAMKPGMVGSSDRPAGGGEAERLAG